MAKLEATLLGHTLELNQKLSSSKVAFMRAALSQFLKPYFKGKTVGWRILHVCVVVETRPCS